MEASHLFRSHPPSLGYQHLFSFGELPVECSVGRNVSLGDPSNPNMWLTTVWATQLVSPRIFKSTQSDAKNKNIWNEFTLICFPILMAGRICFCGQGQWDQGTTDFLDRNMNYHVALKSPWAPHPLESQAPGTHTADLCRQYDPAGLEPGGDYLLLWGQGVYDILMLYWVCMAGVSIRRKRHAQRHRMGHWVRTEPPFSLLHWHSGHQLPPKATNGKVCHGDWSWAKVIKPGHMSGL